MIAPHSLALHGNLVGEWGAALPLGLAAASGILILFIHTLWKPADPPLSFQPELNLPPRLGISLMSLALGAQLLTALTGSTGLLVTAGFSFNEIFLHWFPNFAFAFLLLGLIVLLSLGGARWVLGAQILFTTTALGGLLLVTVIALIRSGTIAASVGGGPLPAVSQWAPLLLLFVGVELALLYPFTSGLQARHLMTFGVLVAALIFALWGWAALRWVPLERLADSTIAPILVAKKAWGQNGRYAMGIVTIAGALAAVNALFTISALTAQKLCRQLGGKGPRLPSAAVTILLGALTAAAMAAGMAGTERIDVALRAGLVLWLFYYAVSVLLQASTLQRRSLLNLLVGILLLAGAGLLAHTHPDRRFLLISMLAGLLTSTLVTSGLWGWARTQKKGVPNESIPA